MYVNLGLILLAANAHNVANTIHDIVMIMIYLNLAQAYRHINKPVNHITNTVHISGIKTNRKNIIALITTKFMKNCLVFMTSYFLINQLDMKRTYHSLKNSAGCRVVTHGIDIHHLAQLKTTHIQGTNTNN